MEHPSPSHILLPFLAHFLSAVAFWYLLHHFVFFFSFSVMLYFIHILYFITQYPLSIWSQHVRHLFVLSCTICCFLPSPNSSSLSNPPLPTHTTCLPPHFPHLLPSDLGQVVFANDVSVDSDLLVVPDGQVLPKGQCIWCQSSDNYSKVFGCQYEVFPRGI